MIVGKKQGLNFASHAVFKLDLGTQSFNSHDVCLLSAASTNPSLSSHMWP